MHRCYDCHTHLSRIHHLWDAPLHKLLYTFCYNSTLVWCTGAWCHTHLFRIHHLCDAPLHELLYTFFLTHHLCYAALHDAIHTCFEYTICEKHRCMNDVQIHVLLTICVMQRCMMPYTLKPSFDLPMPIWLACCSSWKIWRAAKVGGSTIRTLPRMCGITKRA